MKSDQWLAGIALRNFSVQERLSCQRTGGCKARKSSAMMKVGYWLSLYPAIAAACSAFPLFARRLRQT